MNALITRSEEARAHLMRTTGMDDLTYQLMILEAGCTCLDELMSEAGAKASDEAREAYREHIQRIGYWTFFELQWRAFEVRLEAEWYGPESIVPLQSNAWRRERITCEAQTMHRTQQFWNAFELWLTKLAQAGLSHVTLPTNSTKDTQLITT